MIVIIIDSVKIRFTSFILFKPEVHITINSLSFSSRKIVSISVTKKQKGSSLVVILGIVRRE